MNLLKWFFGQNCSHRFSWPRNDAKGRHYQSCLVCGIAYEYDWTRMRRTGRLITAEVQHGYPVEPIPHFVRAIGLAARRASANEISRAHS